MIDLTKLTTNNTFGEMIDAGYEYTDFCDEATEKALNSWFYFRRVQPRFIQYFQRKLSIIYPRYRQMLRIDPIASDYDWFVENYLEKQTVNAMAENGSSSKESESTGSNRTTDETTKSMFDGNTRTYNEANVGSNSGASETNSSNTENSSTTGLTTETQKSNPMSNSITGNRTANGKGMAWSEIINPTSSAANLSDESGSVQSSGVDRTSSSGTNRNDHTGTVTDAGSGSENSNGERNSTNSNVLNESITDGKERESVEQSVLKGRDRPLPEIIENASRVIQETNAFEYLTDELDLCFMSCIDEEE